MSKSIITKQKIQYICIQKTLREDFKMEENYLATSRNGHELRDMYNPETNTLDIRSNGLYPSNVLSNLCSNAFVFDGVECGSMEGFLQSLKQQDRERQRQIIGRYEY